MAKNELETVELTKKELQVVFNALRFYAENMGKVAKKANELRMEKTAEAAVVTTKEVSELTNKFLWED